jgi:hypothetical protein
LVSKDAVLVAAELGYAHPNALYQRLHRLRRNKIEAQEFVNKLNALMSKSPRLRKFLTSGQIKEVTEI